MSDIDFDELDRAVASVLGGSDAPTPAAVAEPIVVVPTDASLKPVAASAQDLHAIAPKPVQRGRFLDMVHPSGDMTSRSATPAMGPVPRPVVDTTNQTFVSDVIAGTLPSLASLPLSPLTSSSPAPARPTAPASSEQPSEPIESVVEPKDQPEPDPQPEATVAPDFFAASPDDANPHKNPEVQPSPFIPDAKVEKRPLGAFTSDSPGNGPLPTGDELHARLAKIEGEDSLEEPDVAAAPAKTSDGKLLLQPVSGTPPAPAVINSTPVASEPTPKKPDHHFNLFGHGEKDTPASHPKLKSAKAPKYGTGTVIRVTVAIAIMLIGLGVGASLYLLVLQ